MDLAHSTYQLETPLGFRPFSQSLPFRHGAEWDVGCRREFDITKYLEKNELDVICGIDEAGRGPVIGPLVVAAVMVRSDRPLREMKVRDSKQLTRCKREELAPKIREVAKVEVIVVPAEEIDVLRDEMSLNVLEAQLFASLLDRMSPKKAYVDAADVVEDRFKRMIESQIKCEPEIICEHSADRTYPVVMAASIIAKTVRDSLIDDIQKEFSEPIGSGYCHDVVTRRFLEDYIRKNGCFPPSTRKSWRTAKEIYALTKLTKLTDWVDDNDDKTDA